MFNVFTIAITLMWLYYTDALQYFYEDYILFNLKYTKQVAFILITQKTIIDLKTETKINTYTINKFKEIGQYINNYLAPNETFVYLGKYHALLYLYSNRNSSIRYAYNDIINTISPKLLEEEMNKKSPDLLVICTDDINSYTIDTNKYQKIYYDNLFSIYATEKLIKQKKHPFTYATYISK